MNGEDTRTPHKIAGFNTLELAAGMIIFIVGLIVALESLRYPFGTLRSVGPAIFHMLLDFILAALGLAIVFDGRTSFAFAPKVRLDYVPVCREEQHCCSNFVSDEGRPLVIGVRALVSNRPLRLSSRAMVVSELGKGRSRIVQVGP